MSAFLSIILFCIKQYNGERSISAIYHLLKGKKSSQTIQDANLFSLSPLFGVLSSLEREDVQRAVNYLEQNKLIKQTSPDVYYITPSGLSVLKQWNETSPLPDDLDGWRYRDNWVIFWKRYTLITQTLSNLLNNNTNFLPVQYDYDIQTFVKHFLKNWNKEQLAKQIKEETEHFLKRVGNENANIFVVQLSGYNLAGHTLDQAATRWKLDNIYALLQFQATIHLLLKTINSEKENYPVLTSMCIDLFGSNGLTKTTQQTYQLIKKNYSLEEIAIVRNLKESTIEDHIVEISMNDPQFSIFTYLNEEQYNAIVCVVRSLKTKQLKKIKQTLQRDDISYFQIRLVLTRLGDVFETTTTAEK